MGFEKRLRAVLDSFNLKEAKKLHLTILQYQEKDNELSDQEDVMWEELINRIESESR